MHNDTFRPLAGVKIQQQNETKNKKEQTEPVIVLQFLY